jgi:uncharacterized protein with FMN-binding domain
MAQAGFVPVQAAVEETEAPEVAEADEDGVAPAADAPFVPGTYSASAAGISSDVTVTVTFDENNIVAVGTYVEGETAGIGADIGDEIGQQIMEAQSAEIDGVTGATITSDAVKEALEACIAQAKEAEESETETEAETAQAKAESGDTKAAEASYKPGVYTAVGTGISSDITVTVEFDETGIVAADADVSGETAGIGAMIDKDMVNRVLEAQSADVDGIAGATITSDAIKAAVAECIEQASK